MLAETLTHVSPALTAGPLVRELPADLETPAGVYLKLRGQEPSFLLESVEGGERVARYSFVGVRPQSKYTVRGREIEVASDDRRRTVRAADGTSPLAFLQSELAAWAPASLGGATQANGGLPRFIGGLVGYLGYEAVRYFEPKLDAQLRPADRPDAIYLLADTLVAFDHARHSLYLIAHALDGDRRAARDKLDALEARLRAPIPIAQPATNGARAGAGFESNLSQPEYESLVRAAKEYVAAGDIFQVVLSQRLERPTSAPPFEIYRALRRLNPSPYMFFFDFGEVDGEPFHLVGASPEMFVRLEGRRASLRPIAGTRPRGSTPADDEAYEQDLAADAKERAEHLMLLDLGRNDLGRVCEYGSLTVPESFVVERYSHVMHLVSRVEGNLRPGLTAFDLVAASFPAGTVSGAPKVRAMEIIAEQEPDARGPYAGAVGYFSFDGAMDTCLAIRTLVAHGSTVSVQAGAGIVADSDPAREYVETMNKARAVMRAVELAEGHA